MGETIFQNISIYLLVITVVLLMVLACAILIPLLTKKGVNIPASIAAAGGTLDRAGEIMAILKGAFPASGIINVVDKIITYAKTGVGNAEQLYIINKITGEDRNREAKEFVYNALKLLGVERNAAIDKIIEGAIEDAVLALGHKPAAPDPAEGYGAGKPG
jgi:hypothetical protein